MVRGSFFVSGGKRMKFEDYGDFHAEPQTVLALFTRRDYFERKYEHLGARDVQVQSCSDDGDCFSIQVHLLEPPNKQLPVFMRKITGNQVAMMRRDSWCRSSLQGTLEIRIDRAPVSIDAAMRLESLAAGARLKLDFDVRARLPVMAARVEKFLAEDLVGRFRADMAETRRQLALPNV